MLRSGSLLRWRSVRPHHNLGHTKPCQAQYSIASIPYRAAAIQSIGRASTTFDLFGDALRPRLTGWAGFDRIGQFALIRSNESTTSKTYRSEKTPASEMKSAHLP